MKSFYGEVEVGLPGDAVGVADVEFEAQCWASPEHFAVHWTRVELDGRYLVPGDWEAESGRDLEDYRDDAFAAAESAVDEAAAEAAIDAYEWRICDA